MNNHKIATVINYVFSGILWPLGFWTFLSNACGLWALWHLAGFGFILYLPITIIPMLVATIVSCIAKDRTTIIMNFSALAANILLTLFTVFVSSTWFWQ